MARKTKDFVVSDEGRDKGKTFVLTEMPAMRVQKWADKAFLALAKAGQTLPDNIQVSGFVGLFILGLKLLVEVQYEEFEPLMDEIMVCVRVRPDPRHPELVRDLVDNDIEEVATIMLLRQEVFELHSGFTLADAVSKLTGASAAGGVWSTPSTSQAP